MTESEHPNFPGRRLPVSLFERVAGCFACENRAGLPIPLAEFPEDGDIGLCIRHWNWWLTHFAKLSPDREPPTPPCAAHLIESEERADAATVMGETGIIYVCAECGTPVETEPCEEHQPAAYARCTGSDDPS